jgi:hypothetical protein
MGLALASAFPCVGLQQGLGGSLHVSRYLGEHTGTLYLALSYLSFCIYIVLSCLYVLYS